MLDNLFLSLLNMSLVASYVIVFVLLIRLALKKTPKIFSYVLWSVVLLRLSCPFSFESVFSLISINKTPIPQDIIYSQAPQISTGVTVVDNIINPILPAGAEIGASINPLQVWIFIGEIIWIIGMIAMAIYSLFSYMKLKRSLITATPLKENIYLADHISTPFVLGVIRPKIYLPSSLLQSEQDYIICHELCHIKRIDHITRILSFIALSVHWFNPLVWVAFALSGKDMELSCDEAVMKSMDTDIKSEYSQSLLRFSTTKKMMHATPLAFGEGDTKDRVKNVLNYKKPKFWVVGIAIIAIMVIGLGLMTNTKNSPIVIPKSNEVTSISIEQINEGETLGIIEISDKSQIEIILKSLQNTNKTMQQSINDSPNRDNYFQIDINGSDLRRFYLYTDKAKYLIEEPYCGIYKTTREASVSIATIYTANGGAGYVKPFISKVENGTATDTIKNEDLTKETANDFINQTLSTFKLNSDNTVSFTLPTQIPTDESGKTKLHISSSAAFSPESGTSSVQEILDSKSDWHGGDSYAEKLDISRGKLKRLFLRVAFMTTAGENSSQLYAADYIELTEPFQFDTAVNITDRNVEISNEGSSFNLKYTLQNGDNFSVALTLPSGIALSTSEAYPEYTQQMDYETPTVVAVKDGTPIGTLTLCSFGTDDKDVLNQIDTAKDEIPMPIFAGIALSNHAQFNNYKVLKSSATDANAVAEYSWQDLTNYGGNAPDAPWLKSDSVLAYDYKKIPFFINLNLAKDSFSITELENLAKSIEIVI